MLLCRRSEEARVSIALGRRGQQCSLPWLLISTLRATSVNREEVVGAALSGFDERSTTLVTGRARTPLSISGLLEPSSQAACRNCSRSHRRGRRDGTSRLAAAGPPCAACGPCARTRAQRTGRTQLAQSLSCGGNRKNSGRPALPHHRS